MTVAEPNSNTYIIAVTFSFSVHC